jgi:hypothetical protein
VITRSYSIAARGLQLPPTRRACPELLQRECGRSWQTEEIPGIFVTFPKGSKLAR